MTQGSSYKSRPMVAIGFISGMLAGYCKNGKSPERLLLTAGIPPEALADPLHRVTLEQCVTLYELLVHALDDEGFGVFASPLRGGSFEFFCRALVSSQNLAEAIERACRFLRVLVPVLAVSVSQEGD